MLFCFHKPTEEIYALICPYYQNNVIRTSEFFGKHKNKYIWKFLIKRYLIPNFLNVCKKT